jgi:hypothetical protein
LRKDFHDAELFLKIWLSKVKTARPTSAAYALGQFEDTLRDGMVSVHTRGRNMECMHDVI